MNVIWTKHKNTTKIYTQDTVTLHAHASGDGGGAPGCCCRLCGGDTNLRSFSDTYVWEGVEERYDKLLYDCFGVRVSSSDCMICEQCVRHLRNTERFRALVHSAFGKTLSEDSTHTIPLQRDTLLKSVTGEKTVKSHKEVLEILKTQISELPKKREVRKKYMPIDRRTRDSRGDDNGGKRIYIQCDVCRQRYPMIMPTDGLKKFVCSRCKKNGEIKSVVCRKCNIGMPFSMMKEHMELHTKADLRGKTRLLVRSPKKAIKRINSANKERVPAKYSCSLCTKKYVVAQNLLLHVRSVHGDNAAKSEECAQMVELCRTLEERPCSHSLAASRSRLPLAPDDQRRL